MKSLTVGILLTFFITFLFHQNIFCQEIEAKIDLKNCINDRILISLNLTHLNKSDSITYRFPKTIPGLYTIVDFGKFIDEFNAYDNSGNLLKTNRNSKNEFVIYNSYNLTKIEYLLNDTWDEALSDESIFYPSGTRFEENNFFLLNLYALIGYFDDNVQLKYKISINKPQNLEIISANKFTKINDSTNVFKFNLFSELAEEPILLSQPDTISFTSNNNKYIINTYSENLQLNSAFLLDTIKSVIEAVNNQFNNLVDSTYYINLVYDNWLDNRGGGMEHKNSCVIVLSNRIRVDHLYFIIKEKVAHEYLHCITPLNLHSIATKNFDYSGKTNTKLLWFYEGVTEYLSMKILLSQKLISTNKFLREIGCNIYDNEKMNDKNYSLETVSKEVLNKLYNDFFMNFYYRGCLTAFAYDIWLQKETKHNLTALIRDIYKDNNRVAFHEDSLYYFFEKYSGAKNDEFIDLYIRDSKELTLNHFFNKIDLFITDSLKQTFVVLRYFITNKSNIKEINNNIYFISDSTKNIFENETAKIIEINNNSINLNNAIQSLMYANNVKFLNMTYEVNNKIIQKDIKTLVKANGKNYYIVLNTYKSDNNKFFKFINSN